MSKVVNETPTTGEHERHMDRDAAMMLEDAGFSASPGIVLTDTTGRIDPDLDGVEGFSPNVLATRRITVPFWALALAAFIYWKKK